MHASRSRTRALSGPLQIWVPLTILALWLALAFSLARAATPTTGTTTAKTTASDSTAGDGGFSVRVREEDGESKTAAAHRAIEKAKEEARRAREQARASGIPPEPPEPPGHPHHVNIDFDSSDNDVVRFGEDITIPEDKVVEGDVVAMGGSVTVLGRVKGDCTSIGGSVHIKGKGVVEGDATSVGGTVTTSDSGRVAGSNVSVGGFNVGSERLWPMIGFFGAMGAGIWVIKTIVQLALTLLFAWLALVFARDRMTYAVDTMTQRFGKSFLWGLLGWAAMVVAIPSGIVLLILVSVIAIVLLAITIIGIPLAILLVIALVLGIVGICVGALLAVFVGYLNGAMFLGQRILGRNAALAKKPYAAIAVGLALIAVLALAGHLLQLVGLLIFHPVSIALGIATGALAAIVTTAGFGAMLLTQFAPGPHGARAVGSQWWPSSGPAPSPAPGPAPAAPPPAAAPPTGGTSDAP